jgi:hypothetical protein
MLFGLKHFKMNLLGEVQTGGGSGELSQSIPSESAPVFTPPEWAKGVNVDQEILKAPMFSSIKSMDDVVKGFYHAQKMVGADKIVVPGKNSSSDEWRNYYVKGGLPEKFDDYKVDLPGSFDDQGFNAEFLKTAYENNVRPDQLQKLTEMFDKSNEKIVAEYEAQQAQELQQVAEELKQEWGQGFDKQIARANRVIKHFGGDELHTQVLNSDLGNNKQFLKLMAKIGEKMTGEDSFNHETTSSFGMTKEEARSKMNAMYGDMASPYFNSDHAQHKEFLNKMLKYQEVLAGN